jgi:hypothetical protein
MGDEGDEGDEGEEIVRQSISEGVASNISCHAHRIKVKHSHAAKSGAYRSLMDTPLLRTQRCILSGSTGFPLTEKASGPLPISTRSRCCCFRTIAAISRVLIFLFSFHFSMTFSYCRSLASQLTILQVCSCLLTRP